MYANSLGQPIGFPLDNWQAAEHPQGSVIPGRLCQLEPIAADAHALDLYQAFSRDLDHRNWTYLPYGPFSSLAEFENWIKTTKEGGWYTYLVKPMETRVNELKDLLCDMK